MYKFLVSVKGNNYQIEREERVVFVIRKSSTVDVGFYATRFVQAASANDAIEQVLEMMKNQLKGIAKETGNSTLEINKIVVDEENYDLFAPGEGFTFYTEETER